ncbi:MAG: glycosyltransferase, partial [SAR202 cluster bacterium]|nr:glycosyltransferase [SAR202 cluster bacterium]
SIPQGWLGKHWACHQLALKANGDYMLFIDADTVLHKNTIKTAINEAVAEKSDLLTMIPARCPNNFIERTLYGFIDWAIYAWLPLQLAHLSKNSYLSASYGQFMLFKRESYILSGGHKKIKDNTVDDLGLGRLIKSSGLRWTLKDGTSMVTSLPYNDMLETMKGVSRSVAPALNYRISLILLISVFLMGLFFAPVFNLYFYVINGDHFEFLDILSLVTIFIHVTVIFMILIAYHSLLSNLFRIATWKDRNVVIKRLKF